MSTSVALVTVGFTFAGPAADSSAASAERRTVHRTRVTAIPGEMSGTVTPVAHNSTAHD